MDKLKNKMEAVQRNWTANEPSEKRIVESLSNKSEPPSQAMLDRLVADSFDTTALMHINRHVFSTLNSPPRNYRAIFKALTVIEHLCLYGSDRFVSEALTNVEQVKKLLNMRYTEGGEDKCAAVRMKAEECLDFLSSKTEIQQKRKLFRQRHVPGGQTNLSLAAFEQKHKELLAAESSTSTSSVDGKQHLKKEQGSRRGKNRDGKSSTPEVRSRSSTQELGSRSSTQEARSRSSTQDGILSYNNSNNPQSWPSQQDNERTRGFSAHQPPSQDLFNLNNYENSTASTSWTSLSGFHDPLYPGHYGTQAVLRRTSPTAVHAAQPLMWIQEQPQQYPPQAQDITPAAYQTLQQPYYPQNNNPQYQQVLPQQQQQPQQIAYPPQQYLPQQGVGGVTPQQYWQQQQQPMDQQQQQQYIGQPSQQWNQPPVSGGTCFAPVQPSQQQQGNSYPQATAAYEQSGTCRGSSDCRPTQYLANEGTQFTAISSQQSVEAQQQPNRNLVDEGGHEAHAANIAAVDHHQHQEQQQHNQTSQRIPTFAAMQANPVEQLCNARGRLRPVGLGVPRQQQSTSVFEGIGVAAEKQLDQKHVDNRRACLASSGGDEGEEVVVGTSVESSEFQAMHQKLRHTNLQ